jgi:hypothetical protein
MMEATNIRNIMININENLMHIQRRKGTQNPSLRPPDPKEKRRELHVQSQRILFGIHMHAKTTISDVSNTLEKQPWRSYP